MRSVDVFRGILKMIGKKSQKKFEVLKQVESGLNVSKAFVLWKHNAEVKNIDQSLEHQYKNLVLIKFNLILNRQVKNQNLLSFNALKENNVIRIVDIRQRNAYMKKYFKAKTIEKTHDSNTAMKGTQIKAFVQG